jgi:death-on-curing protein
MTSSKPTRKLNYPTVDQVEELHSRILDLTGGEHGDLSRSNLEYLLEAVKDVGRKQETNKAILKKAAYILYNFVVQHPFVNGNKRTALELVTLFLRMNNYEITAAPERIYNFLSDIAAGKESLTSVEKWIATNLAEPRKE